MATISIPRRRPLTLSLPRVTSEGVIYVAVFLVVANLVLIPLALVLLEAFNLGPIHSVAGGATLNNFVIAWSSPVTHAVLWNTVVFAVCSTILTTTIGVFFAFMIERTDMPMKNFAYAIVPLTIAMPGLLYGIAWVLLLSPRIGLFNLGLMGLFGQQNGLLTSWAGIGLTRTADPAVQHGRHDLRGRHPRRRRRVPDDRRHLPQHGPVARRGCPGLGRPRAHGGESDYVAADDAGHPGGVHLLADGQPRDLRHSGHHGPARRASTCCRPRSIY